MRPPPDAVEVLGRVARFLSKDVQVEDKATAFRLKVAAFLIGAVARDLAAGDALREGAVQALAELLDEPAPAPASSAALAGALLDQEARLAARLASGDLDPAQALPLLKRQLALELSLTNPRFDTGDDIEPREP